jgi:hypothetical protein
MFCLNRQYLSAMSLCRLVATKWSIVGSVMPVRRSDDGLIRHQVAGVAGHNSESLGLWSAGIAARHLEATGGRLWANQRERIQRQLEKLVISRTSGASGSLAATSAPCGAASNSPKAGNSTSAADVKKEAMASAGWYMAIRCRSQPADNATNTHRLRTHSVSDVPRLDVTRCQFITGDALDELHKMKSGTVNTIITSPAYWPIKLTYGGAGIGYEATVAE